MFPESRGTTDSALRNARRASDAWHLVRSSQLHVHYALRSPRCVLRTTHRALRTTHRALRNCAQYLAGSYSPERPAAGARHFFRKPACQGAYQEVDICWAGTRAGKSKRSPRSAAGRRCAGGSEPAPGGGAQKPGARSLAPKPRRRESRAQGQGG